jgi:uncharacterized protein YbbC (DUF1343 family)
MSVKVLFGCDRLLAKAESLKGRRFGFLGHGASITADLRPTHLALAEKAGAPAALFGPEHGFYGVEQDMVASAHEKDPWTGAAIVSLYGDDEHSLKPRAEAFAGLDLLVIDLQDVGSRYYTFAATAVWAAEVALGAGLEVYLLDRPNPLGGALVEGNRIEPGFESFVGALDLPVRHGLTMGEILRLEGRRRGWPERFTVFTLGGWRRTMLWEQTGRPWIAPSPNMPTPQTALVYPGGCLVEATQLSEGRGTTRPFELVGAPGIEPLGLARELEALQLPGVAFLPTYFKPQFQKHAGKVCGGVQVVVRDARTFAAYRCGLELLRTIARLHPGLFAWRAEAYEFVSDRAAIDLLTGSATFREALEAGVAGGERMDGFYRTFRRDEDRFFAERGSILLYD